MAIEKYRKTMNNDVLHAWAADAQAELEDLRAQLQSLQGAGEAVAWQYQSRCGEWCNFTDEKHRVATAEDGTWPMRALYTHQADPDAVPVRRELLERIIECTPGTWMAKELRALLADSEGVKP